MILKIQLILFVLLGVFSIENAHSQWTTENGPTTENLNSICLFNGSSGWIVGDKGTMLYKDKGVWMKYNQVTDENLFSVFLVDNYEGWAVGSKGTILHFNGGKWENFTSPTNAKLYSVSFSDTEHGIAVGEYGTVVVYENGEWELAEKVTIGNLYAVTLKKNIAMIGGGLEWVNVPIMSMSVESEKSIHNSFDPHFIEIKSLATPNEANMWAVGRSGAIFHFTGNNWLKFEQFEKLPTLNSVYFSDTNHGISVGYSGTIMIYSDEGWTKVTSPVNVKLNGAAISENRYYAVGNNGTIVTMKKAASPFEEQKIMKSTANIATYPNPSAGTLKILIPDIDDNNAGIITVTNSFGQVLIEKNINSLTSGEVFELNTSNLANGIYMVTITSFGMKTATGKFIVRH